MKQPNAPCMDCTDRVPPTPTSNGCKSYCERWKQYESELEEWREDKRKRWLVNEAVRGYDNEKSTKVKKANLKKIQDRRKNGR